MLDEILLETERIGSFAIQTDHPGLMKNIKKKKTTKKDRSFFVNDKDAGKKYITGVMDASGRPKKVKIHEILSKRLEILNDN